MHIMEKQEDNLATPRGMQTRRVTYARYKWNLYQ